MGDAAVAGRMLGGDELGTFHRSPTSTVIQSSLILWDRASGHSLAESASRRGHARQRRHQYPRQSRAAGSGDQAMALLFLSFEELASGVRLVRMKHRVPPQST